MEQLEKINVYFCFESNKDNAFVRDRIRTHTHIHRNKYYRLFPAKLNLYWQLGRGEIFFFFVFFILIKDNNTLWSCMIHSFISPMNINPFFVALKVIKNYYHLYYQLDKYFDTRYQSPYIGNYLRERIFLEPCDRYIFFFSSSLFLTQLICVLMGIQVLS